MQKEFEIENLKVITDDAYQQINMLIEDKDGNFLYRNSINVHEDIYSGPWIDESNINDDTDDITKEYILAIIRDDIGLSIELSKKQKDKLYEIIHEEFSIIINSEIDNYRN